MYNIVYKGSTGVTVGQRKDGSKAVLWSDNTITWLSPAELSSALVTEV